MLIEKENLGLIFGSPASGKSLLVQDMAFCIAAGLPFHGKETTQGNVLYIAGEGFSGLKKRFMALSQEYGYLAKGLYFSKQPAALMDKQNALDVAETVKAIGNVSLIVIDTLHRNMGAGDENSSRDWGEFQNNIDNYLRPLARRFLSFTTVDTMKLDAHAVLVQSVAAWMLNFQSRKMAITSL